MVLTTRWARACLVLTAAAGLLAQRTPDEALRALHEGNQRFAAGQSAPRPLGEGVRRTLARGENPFAIVLCCADSRTAPEHVFNTGLGDLFVVRIAGNTCNAEALASIEYAVEQLNVPLCVVLGHESCGAVAAAVAQAQDGPHPAAPRSPAMAQLLERIEPAVRKVLHRDLDGKALTDAVEEENAHLAVHECLRRSALLQRYTETGKFRMVAARYHLDSGAVDWLPARPLPQAPEPAKAQHGAEPVTMPPHTALRLLQAGHRRFLGDGRPTADLTAHRREQLTSGQRPAAIVLCCADSRIAPEHVFDAGLGELFVVRIAGTVLNDDALASIEYAASHTGAPLLVVMGHTNCSTMAAAVAPPDAQQLTPNLRALLARLEPSVEKARAFPGTGRDLVALATQGHVRRTVADVRARSTMLRDFEARGRFVMLPALYDVASGDVTWLEDTAPADSAPADLPPLPAAPGGETAPVAAPSMQPAEPAEPMGPKFVAPPPVEPDAAPAAPAEAVEVKAPVPHPLAVLWQDPVVLVGLSGVASLLLAALVTMLRK